MTVYPPCEKVALKMPINRQMGNITLNIERASSENFIGGRIAAAARGTTQNGGRLYNERLALSLIRQYGQLPKAEIARLTGLSAQTVSVIVRQLERDNLVMAGDKQRGKVGQKDRSKDCPECQHYAPASDQPHPAKYPTRRNVLILSR